MDGHPPLDHLDRRRFRPLMYVIGNRLAKELTAEVEKLLAQLG